MLCFHCCRLSLAAMIRSYSPVVGCGLLVAVTSLLAEHGFYGTRISALAAPGLNSCGLVAPRHVTSAWLGIEPVSPAFTGGFFTTEPPGRPCTLAFISVYYFTEPRTHHYLRAPSTQGQPHISEQNPRPSILTGIHEEPRGSPGGFFGWSKG